MLPIRRLLPASAVAAAALLLTAGCASSSASGDPSSSAAPSASGTSASASASTSAAPLACAQPGSVSNAVKATGSGAAEPKVSFPTGTTTTSVQRTVLKAGSGGTVKQGDEVAVAYVIYDAKTSKRLDAQGWGKTSATVFPIDSAQLLPGLVEAMNCTKEGERFAAVIPASEAFGTTGSEQLGVGGGDSLVLVADVKQIVPTKADGKAQSLPSGFPSVTLAASGQPTVKIPATDPPKTLRIADREVGTGETVRDGDTVTVQYQGVLWRTGEVFDQSWTKGGATSFKTTDVVKGFGKALVGQKVGSQVVAIIPPADGYGSNGQGAIKGTDTMVFVIDVLATKHA